MRRPPSCTGLTAVLLALTLFPPLASGETIEGIIPWGTFSTTGARGAGSTAIDLGWVMVANTAGVRPETTWIREPAERIWVARKRVSAPGAPDGVQWADSRTCYPLIETLSSLTDLEAPGGPGVAVEDRDRAYRVEALGVTSAGDGTLRLKSGRAAPVRTVIVNALVAWRSCWSDTPPTLAARPDRP